MYNSEPFPALPQARTTLKGSARYPLITGNAYFYTTPHGVLTVVRVRGLPAPTASCTGRFFALHIHERGDCTGNAKDPFTRAGAHDNPSGCAHPDHAGDLPPLLGAGGYAFGAFVSDRFTVEQIIGKSLILHAGPDDFTAQPAGNAGERIACGIIVRG